MSEFIAGTQIEITKAFNAEIVTPATTPATTATTFDTYSCQSTPITGGTIMARTPTRASSYVERPRFL